MSNAKVSGALFAIILVGCAMVGMSSVYGQQTTERYIPIGQSPGISGKYSYIGEIVSVDAAAHTIVVSSDRGRKTIIVTPETKIWLDRSTLKQTNTIGSYDDCEAGRRVEVMHIRDDDGVAAWIKIETK